jgi:hypothetical protein
MSDSMENPFAVNETVEQAPRTERERMMVESDVYGANEINTRINKDAILSSMIFSSSLNK